MARPRQEGLTAREIELIQVLWQQKEATVEMIQAKLPDRLEGSTIRTLLQIMGRQRLCGARKAGTRQCVPPRNRTAKRSILGNETHHSKTIWRINRTFAGAAG